MDSHAPPAEQWEGPQRWLVRQLHGHLLLLPTVGLAIGWGLLTSLAQAVPVAVLAALSHFVHGSRRVRAAATSPAHDALTGIADAEQAMRELQEAVADIQKGSPGVAVLYVDVDHFRLINDAFGRESGDLVLVELVSRLRLGLREYDRLGRVGVDEFVAVCPGVTCEADALALAARVSNSLQAPFAIGEHRRMVSCSVGVAFARTPGQPASSLIRQADAALSRAKANGRSRVELGDERTMQAADERLELERDLQVAVVERTLSLHYQPIVDLRTGAVPGVEALLRWEHPRRGWVATDDLMTVAESSGLIVPLGRWVLTEACMQAARWASALMDRPPLRVFVNASPREIMHPTFLHSVRAALAGSRIDPSRILLEVTEHGLMEGAVAMDVLVQLRRMGIRVVLDDFGSGHSSLSKLARFPVDLLKLDRAFVSGEYGGDAEGPILDAVVQLAGGLGLPVVAEGVETQSQLESVVRHGFGLAQGYYLAKPQPAGALALLLAQQTPFAETLSLAVAASTARPSG